MKAAGTRQPIVSNADEVSRLRAEVARLEAELEQARVAAEDADERIAELARDCKRLQSEIRDRVAAHRSDEHAAEQIRGKMGSAAASLFALEAEQARGAEAEEELRVTIEEMQVLAEELEGSNEALRALNLELDRKIAERTAALEEQNRRLEESEAKLHLALQHAEASSWEWDVAADRLTWSRGFPVLHGMPQGAVNLSSEGWAGLLHVEDRGRVLAALGACAGGQRSELVAEYRVMLPGGRLRWLSARGRMHAGRLLGLAMDVTARRASEAALERANLELNRRVEAEMAAREAAQARLRQRQKLEAIGQLTGGLAHDFNNLLTVIQGGLSLLESSDNPERRTRLMGAIWEATERGADLTRRLLAFGRQQALRPEPVVLPERIDGLRDFLRHALRPDIRLTIDIPPDTWPVRADSGALELALLNLATNARDAMPAGGRITLRAHNRVLDQVEAEHLGLSAGPHVALAVEDEGVGMAAEVLERAFDPFFTTKGLGHGTGLGLPQVYGFARQSGGTATIRSTQRRGTTVTLLLPRALESGPAAAPAAEAHPPSDAGAGRHGRILVVEDDPGVAEVVTDLLRQFGHEVHLASSAEDALGLLAGQERFDLVFSDVLLPGGASGLDLAREVTRTRPGLPIVLTTGYSGSAAEQADAAMYTLLRKPYPARALAEVVSRAIAQPERQPGEAPPVRHCAEAG
jgi:signal transduction histidine kinase/ActR/RegA family two-component response regulator